MTQLADGTSFSIPTEGLPFQWFILGLMAVLFVGGAFFANKWAKRSPVVYAPLTRKEAEIGGRFFPANKWRHWRNPLKELRRFLQWPSGRQWTKLRKQYNRMMPDGALRFAGMATNVRQNIRNMAAERKVE
jgi:hypothetical protein